MKTRSSITHMVLNAVTFCLIGNNNHVPVSNLVKYCTNKKLYTTLLAFILFASGFAQPVVRTQKDLGGNDLDFFTAMALTKDGGRIAGGYSLSNISGQKTENSRGAFDYWIVKLDSANKIEFDKTIGGSKNDILTALQQTNDGGYIVGGYSFSDASGEKTQNSKGSADYWVVKLDNKGNIEWDKTIGGKSFDDLFALQQTSDSGYILGGYSASNKSGDKTENSRGGTDYWVVKLDSKGNIQFDKTIGGNDADDLTSLQQTSDGGYILGGGSFSNISGEKTENSKGVEDFWIVKLNSKGKVQFDKTIGGSETDQVNALQQTSDGGFILGGHSFSDISGDKTENRRGSNGFPDYWVVKLDGNGNIEWDKTLGGDDLDILTSLQQTRDEGYILGGRSFSNISGEKTENSRGGDDYWVVKLDKNGKKQFDKTIGGTDFDECYSIKEAGKNRYVAGGWSLSNATGEKTSKTKGERDYWLVDVAFKTAGQIAETTSENIASVKIPSTDFSVYPNPAKDVLHIQSENKTVMVLSDASGKTVLTQNINGNADINISHLPAGLYYAKNLATGAVKKVVIER